MALACLDGRIIYSLTVAILHRLTKPAVLLPHVSHHALGMRRIADDGLLITSNLLRSHPLAPQRLAHGIGHSPRVIAVDVATQEAGPAEHHIDGATIHRQGLLHPTNRANHRLEAILADCPAGEGVA
ncbi:hypothetical protein D3C75_868370 [compost metagenome]